MVERYVLGTPSVVVDEDDKGYDEFEDEDTEYEYPGDNAWFDIGGEG